MLYDFEWTVPANGFTLTPAPKPLPGSFTFWAEPGFKLTPIEPIEPARRYNPMGKQHADLFLQFAALTSEQDVLAFANQYGNLEKLNHTVETDAEGKTTVRAFHEGTNSWLFDASHMAAAVSIWRGLTTRLPLSEVRARKEQLQTAVNSGLGKGNALSLAWNEVGGLSISYAPRDLLGALWLQLALAIDNSKEYRPCRTCGRLIEISKAQSGRRRNSLFCENKCKVKDYRAGRRARALAASGLTATRIGAELGVPKARVLAWVKRK
jgi:hypothetical protein